MKLSDQTNVVYVGDTVQWPINMSAVNEGTVIYSRSPFIIAADDAGDTFEDEMEHFTTPDGKPVTGFGGANVSTDEFYFNGDPAQSLSDYWLPLVNDQQVGRVETSRGEAIDEAVNAACKLYGEWIRKPTMADLERRGMV